MNMKATMNIITHLTSQVTPVVHTSDKGQREVALLEKFYSILLARMTDTKAYNKLSKNGKLASKKLTLYKLLNNISWEEEDSSKQIISKLAENHDMEEDKVKILLRKATPLVFAEVISLADKQKLPDYLQQLLNDPTTSFSNYIPKWALTDVLPTGLIPETVVSATESMVVATDTQEENTNTKDDIQAKTVGEKKETAKTTSKTTSETTKKALPKPVHADASEYSFENIVAEDNSATTNSTTKTKENKAKQLLPIMGLVVMAVIFWAFLRGCQDSTDSVTSVTEGATVKNSASTDSKTNEQTDEVTEKQNIAPTLIHLATNKEGKLSQAQVFTGNGKSADKIKSMLKEVFAEISTDNSDIQVKEKRSADIPTEDKLPKLLALIKDKPNTSIYIEGNDIHFTTKNKAEQASLVTQAQVILSGFTVSASDKDKSKSSKNTKADKNNKTSKSNQPTASKIVKLPANDLAVVKLEAVDVVTNQAKSTPELKVQSNSIKSNSVQSNSGTKEVTDTKQAMEAKKITEAKQATEKKAEATKPLETKPINIAEEVNKSISASKKVLDGLDKNADIKAVEQALNMQIINFAVNDNQIPKANKAILDQAAKVLKRMNAKVTIIGHTDADGEADYNKRLSEDRSFAVKKYLMTQGLSSKQMVAEGAGESKPIADNSTEAGKFRNRRIEFKVYKPKAKSED